MTYYVAKERCYVGTRWLEPGDGVDFDFGKEKEPPHLVKGEPPAPAFVPPTPEELAAMKAELADLRRQITKKPAKDAE